jgi:hypothetical protein
MVWPHFRKARVNENSKMKTKQRVIPDCKPTHPFVPTWCAYFMAIVLTVLGIVIPLARYTLTGCVIAAVALGCAIFLVVGNRVRPNKQLVSIGCGYFLSLVFITLGFVVQFVWFTLVGLALACMAFACSLYLAVGAHLSSTGRANPEPFHNCRDAIRASLSAMWENFGDMVGE